MFSDYKFVDYCVMSILVVATPFSHRKINIYRIFSCPFKALVRGRVIVVAKKYNYRVPSSAPYRKVPRLFTKYSTITAKVDVTNVKIKIIKFAFICLTVFYENS